MQGSSTEWSQNPFMSLELSVTLIAMIIVPFIGHLLSARLREAHSTSLPIIEFNPLAQPLKQVLSLPPLYGQETGDLKECAPPEHLSQFAIMSLFSYQPFFSIPCWTGTWGQAVSPSTRQNAESSVDSSYLLNEGMQPHRIPQLPRGRARLTKRQTGETRVTPSGPPPCGVPSPCIQTAGGKRKDTQVAHALSGRSPGEQAEGRPSLSKYLTSPPECSSL